MKRQILSNLGNFLRRTKVWDDASSDPRVQEMQKVIRQSGGINFKIEHTSSGEWVAESTNVDGIITGGKDYPNDVNDQIKDAIFTFFEIPPQFCSDTLLKKEGEVAKIEERVYA